MPDRRFTLHVDPTESVLAAARHCEAAVFLEAYGNTTGEWQEEYGPYEAASMFLAIADPVGYVVACARLIMPNPGGLKSLVDTERAPWFNDADTSAARAGMRPDQTCDIATLAVRRNVAGAGVLSAALYHAMVAVIRANALRWVVMIMDARARRLLSMLSLETHVLPGTQAAPYLGSGASIPIFADVLHMMDVQSSRNPDGHAMISGGIGLDAIALPAPAGFVVAPRFAPDRARFVPERCVVGAPSIGAEQARRSA